MAMNIFRFLGDASHQVAILLLIFQLVRTKNARGISVKTQQLRLLVFCTRYLDLLLTFYSMYNSIVKIVYIVVTSGIVYMITRTEPYKSTYNRDQDSFPIWTASVLPCAVLAFLTHLIGEWLSAFGVFNLLELCWTFSIYLESVAILPQLLVLRKYRLVENLTGRFVFFLGMYRVFYILNWIYRAHTEPHYRHHLLVYVCGVIQTGLYGDFFYQYCRITRMSRCCCKKSDLETEQGDTGDLEGLIFEADREMHTMDALSKQSLLSSENNNSMLMTDDEEDARRRRFQPALKDAEEDKHG